MSTEPVYPEAFEPNEFWEEHRNKLIGYAALFLVAVAGYGIYAFTSSRKEASANKAYAEAVSVADYKAVRHDYPGTPVASNAALELGDKLRQEKNYVESAAVLKDFIAKAPEHPLVCAAWTSLGATYETEGKPEEALKAYQEASTKFPDSYVAPIALNAQARILAAQGKVEEARRIYQDSAARFPNTAFGRDAARELRFLRK